MVLATGGLYISKEIKVRQFVAHMPKPITVGQSVKIAGVSGKTTLVLELSPTCPHCLANEPLYRQLSALPQIRDGNVQVVVAIATRDRQLAQAFVDRDGIPGFLIVADGGDKFPFYFYSTPTILLLDPNGVVVGVWIGELHGDEARKFVAKLS